MAKPQEATGGSERRGAARIDHHNYTLGTSRQKSTDSATQVNSATQINTPEAKDHSFAALGGGFQRMFAWASTPGLTTEAGCPPAAKATIVSTASATKLLNCCPGKSTAGSRVRATTLWPNAGATGEVGAPRGWRRRCVE